ncbi:hypothetical protein [uncultured Methanolobus sp.]|uniref:hypothetical protein n=1 Tax=uncultured Methanolobus sp. TaxID=218300 RepID=UPI0029C925A6|nr:hypothetical protein [uncultured Methanolobus sp.]
MKQNKLLLLSIFIVLSLSFVATAEQLSEYEVSKIASSYTYDNELCEPYGPYEYNNDYYYVCSILENDLMKSEIVIDANTGSVVTSDNIAKFLIKHDLALYYLYDEEMYQLNIDNADIYRQNVDVFKDYYDFWSSIQDSASTDEQKQNAKDAMSISHNLMLAYESKVEVTEKLIEVQNEVKSGGTLDSATRLIEAEESSYYAEKQFLKTLDDAIERTPVIYDTILNSNYRYGISEDDWELYKSTDIAFLKREKDMSNSNIAYWESMEDTLNSDTQWFYESMMDRVQEAETANTTPSFTFPLSILSFLVIGRSLKRKE